MVYPDRLCIYNTLPFCAKWVDVIVIVSAKFSGNGDVEEMNDYKVRSKKMHLL
jgi:hypothetical protein